MNIWILLIGDQSLIYRKENENEYDPHDPITRNTFLLDVRPKIYLVIFGNSYLSLRYQFVLGSYVKESTVVQVIALKFLYALFFKTISKE